MSGVILNNNFCEADLAYERLNTTPIFKLQTNDQYFYIENFVCIASIYSNSSLRIQKPHHDGYIRRIEEDIEFTWPNWHQPLIDFLRNLQFEIVPWVDHTNTAQSQQLLAQEAVLQLCEKINDISILNKKMLYGVISANMDGVFTISIGTRAFLNK